MKIPKALTIIEPPIFIKLLHTMHNFGLNKAICYWPYTHYFSFVTHGKNGLVCGFQVCIVMT